MNRLLLTFLFISYLIPCKGQNQANIWYFGSNAGIDFNGSTPTPLLNSNMVSSEGTAVASAANGSVLFYTNGETVWNRNHQQMETGLKGSSLATQSSLIIPKPGSASRYYIFTVADLASFNGLKYSEVDMTAAGGLGAVISKNNHLETFVTEKLTAVRHRNGTDYWVLVHERSNSVFKAYQVTANGLQGPVSSTVGSVHSSSTGYMKFSPNGEKVACAVGQGANFVEVFNFNDSSGVLSSPMKLEYNTIPYGVEFSPNSKRLYVTSGNKIYQYTLPAINNSTLLNFTEFKIECDGLAWALQAAKDHKIYVCKQGAMLGVINNPDNDPSFIDYRDNYVSLGGRLALQGLPNFIQNLFANEYIVAENGCVGQPLGFWLRLNDLDSVRWNFGDGRPGSVVTSFTPSYKYIYPGAYTVSATVYENGYSQTFTKSVTINALPQFSLGNDTNLCRGSSINYNINVPGATYLWSTGNRTGKQVIAGKGVYFLEVTQNGCTLRDSITISQANLKASFTINNPTQCITANKFEFISTSVGAKSHKWFINGVDAGSAAKLSHSFALPGIYTVSIVATSAMGCVDSAAKDISVNSVPKANFDIKIENNCGESNKILITNSTNYSGKYEFELESDGYKIKTSPYTFHYSKPGTYSISLFVKTEDGCSDKITKTVTVYAMPEAAFTIDRQGVCSNNNMFVLSKKSILNTKETIVWFADGKQIATGGDKQTWSFTMPGKHIFKAEVTNAVGCKKVYEEEVEVFKNPVADFTTSSKELKCLGDGPVEFISEAKDDNVITSYTWDFGDNTTASVANPVKKYNQQGAFSVKLTVVNSKGCEASISQEVSTFEKPVVAVAYQDMGHCENQNSFLLSFSNSNPSAEISQFTWDLKGASGGTTNPVWVSYPKAGDYKAGVKVETANGCSAEAETTIKVYPLPTGQLAVNTENQCLNDNRFIVSSHYNAGTSPIITYNWNLGDGNTVDGVDNIEAVYTETGRYTISLDVTDANGCKARFEKQVVVNPSPEFTLESTNACTGQPVKLNFNGLDNNLYVTEWQWNFGDGGTSNMAQPTHTYNTPGTYLASLTVTTSGGCSYVSRASVNVFDLPLAGFTCKRTTWGFEETDMEFKSDIDEPGYTYSWNFGNGKTSTNPVEVVRFDKAGTYDVMLTITSPSGCSGIVEKQVVIYPPFDAFVPTSFTPNNDGKNDVFGMEGVQYIQSYKMEIFNRWGQTVFATTELNHKWDGKFNEQALPPGMFTYVITILDMDGKPYSLIGSVQLIR